MTKNHDKKKTCRKNKRETLIQESIESFNILKYEESDDDNESIIFDDTIPRNITQQNYLHSLQNDDISVIFCIGPAGCGKTYIPSSEALKQLLQFKKFKKILVTRPAVSNDEELGFLPGSFEDKLEPYLRPIYDMFCKQISYSDLRYYIHSKIIEICPLSYLRGRTFDDSFIIADEMQNSTISQMKMLLTRIGNNSKLVITGDLCQSDIKEDKMNGLEDFIHRFNKADDIHKHKLKLITFSKTDIERNPVISNILDIYNIND